MKHLLANNRFYEKLFRIGFIEIKNIYFFCFVRIMLFFFLSKQQIVNYFILKYLN